VASLWQSRARSSPNPVQTIAFERCESAIKKILRIGLRCQGWLYSSLESSLLRLIENKWPAADMIAIIQTEIIATPPE